MQYISGTNDGDFTVSVLPKVDFSGWELSAIPANCSTIRFEHNGKAESRRSSTTIKTDVLDECSHSRVTSVRFSVLDGSIPDQDMLVADCALKESGVYIEVVASTKPAQESRHKLDSQTSEKDAVDLLQRQVTQLRS